MYKGSGATIWALRLDGRHAETVGGSNLLFGRDKGEEANDDGGRRRRLRQQMADPQGNPWLDWSMVESACLRRPAGDADPRPHPASAKPQLGKVGSPAVPDNDNRGSCSPNPATAIESDEDSPMAGPLGSGGNHVSCSHPHQIPRARANCKHRLPMGLQLATLPTRSMLRVCKQS